MKIVIVLSKTEGFCIAGSYPDTTDNNIILDEVYAHNGSVSYPSDTNSRIVDDIPYTIYGNVEIFENITEEGLLRNPLYLN